TEQAIALARGCDDPTVLRACLLARHDVLWSPGGGAQRVPVIDELIALARRCGSPDWLAEALVLQANALLESGSAAFSAVLHEALTVLAGLDEPRHAYTALTRRACLALLRGELADAERLIDEATALGGRLREPDTANVRMSQRLELVRARSDPAELQSFAAEAVAHWTGAPVHAHAVAAGFQARAADLEAARHHVSVVQELGTWRSDRSYLWSVFVRELATAAIALDDAPLMQQLLSDVRPLRGTCGVNGAAVAFAGCHSRVAAELAAALGDPDAAALLAEAQQVEARVGAAPRRAPTSLHREGAAWRVTWEGRTATVPHCKGLLDLAELLRRPREDVHVLDLMQAGAVAPDAGPALDRTAAQGYRRRLEELAAERASAERAGDAERVAAVDDETAVLAAELGRSSGLAGRPRPLGSSTTERARKAVTARIRDAVQRIDAVLPDLAAHLSHEVVTGVRCRYAGDRRWDVST
ncbi:MAG: hypothetical protein JO246_17985, partial [Frankiaceae bacterium]|nr:hypothetical protein [Frankiaceae bacterium]